MYNENKEMKRVKSGSFDYDLSKEQADAQRKRLNTVIERYYKQN